MFLSGELSRSLSPHVRIQFTGSPRKDVDNREKPFGPGFADVFIVDAPRGRTRGGSVGVLFPCWKAARVVHGRLIPCGPSLRGPVVALYADVGGGVLRSPG